MKSTYDFVTFGNESDFRSWLNRINKWNENKFIKPYNIIKVYSNGPQYFYVFFEHNEEEEQNAKSS